MMELNEAILILQEGHFEKKWQFWQKTDLLSEESPQEALRILKAKPSEDVIPPLAYLVWNAAVPLREALEPIFMAHVMNIPYSRWLAVDEAIRSWAAWTATRGFSLKNEHFLSNDLSASESLIVIAACHTSGQIRQSAVKKLVFRLPKSLAAAIHLVRMNDWVEPIRNLAADLFLQKLPHLSSTEQLAVVPLLAQLRGRTRHGADDSIDQWDLIISQNLDLTEWVTQWNSCSAKDRKYYFRLLKISNVTLSKDAQKAILTSNDRRAIIWVLREALPRPGADHQNETWHIFQNAKAIPLRREWLAFLAENHRAEAYTQLLEALLDKSKSLRQLAQYYLSHDHHLDLTAFYQNSVTNPEYEATSLLGLLDIAPQEAAEHAVTRLDSVSASVLRAAICCLSSEDLNKHLGFLIEALQSPLPGVSKVAKLRLAELYRELGARIVADPLLWQQLPDALKKLFIGWAPHFQKWDALEFLLTRLADTSWSADAEAAFQKWWKREQRSCVRLSPSRKESLTARATSAGLSSHAADCLRFLLEKSI